MAAWQWCEAVTFVLYRAAACLPRAAGRQPAESFFLTVRALFAGCFWSGCGLPSFMTPSGLALEGFAQLDGVLCHHVEDFSHAKATLA